MMITEATTRQELIAVWHDNMSDLMDAFLAADVDPDLDTTPTDAIRNVIVSWIEAGDECSAA